MRVLERFDEPVSSGVWAPDSQTFITGSFDKSRSLCTWNLRGDRIYTWTTSHRTEDIALSADQRWLAAMDEQRTVHLYNYGTREHIYDLSVNARPSSLSISGDSRYMLITKIDNESVLIDIDTRETVAKYSGLSGGQFTIRSGFGGANENFVISGSEGKQTFAGKDASDPSYETTANGHIPRNRWPGSRLAQADWHSGVRGRSSPPSLQLGRVASDRPLHVRYVWRRRQGQDVSVNFISTPEAQFGITDAVLSSFLAGQTRSGRRRLLSTMPGRALPVHPGCRVTACTRAESGHRQCRPRGGGLEYTT